MRSAIVEDLRRYVPMFDQTHGIIRLARCAAAMLLHPGWSALFTLRLAQWLRCIYMHPISWLLYRFNMLCFSIDIHPAVRLGKGAWLPHPFGIVIARDAVIGESCTIYQNVTVGGRGNPPVIGNYVTLGSGCCVLGPAKLGDGAIVGANSVVTKDIPSGATVVGAPMRILDTDATGESNEES